MLGKLLIKSDDDLLVELMKPNTKLLLHLRVVGLGRLLRG